jgi:hypothetical protein
LRHRWVMCLTMRSFNRGAVVCTEAGVVVVLVLAVLALVLVLTVVVVVVMVVVVVVQGRSGATGSSWGGVCRGTSL